MEASTHGTYAVINIHFVRFAFLFIPHMTNGEYTTTSELVLTSTCRVLWSIPDCMHNLSNGEGGKEKERGREVVRETREDEKNS